MGKYSNDDVRSRIIGLGESSVKKSYYPLLQEKIRILEEKQTQLMKLVRELEERETELEELLDTKTALLKEVNHRVKNNLQLIGSLINLGAAHADDEEFLLFMKTKSRIDTISYIYQEFLFSESYVDVAFCSLLRGLANEVKSDTGKSEVELDFIFPVEEIIMNIDTAIPLSLIVNEVFVNSFRYAFAGGTGTLKITLAPNGDNIRIQSFVLNISDSGPGFPNLDAGADSSKLGLVLIDALVLQIGGKYSLENSEGGAVFTLEFQLT